MTHEPTRTAREESFLFFLLTAVSVSLGDCRGHAFIEHYTEVLGKIFDYQTRRETEHKRAEVKTSSWQT